MFLAEEFGIYLNYVRKLGFEETPDYDFLRELFTKVIKSMGEVEDGVYDWNLLNGGKGWEACVASNRDRERERRAEERERRHREAVTQMTTTNQANGAAGGSPAPGTGTNKAGTQPPRRPHEAGVTRSRTPPATLALNGALPPQGSNAAVREPTSNNMASVPLAEMPEDGALATDVATPQGGELRQRHASQQPPAQSPHPAPVEPRNAHAHPDRKGGNKLLQVLTCGCA